MQMCSPSVLRKFLLLLSLDELQRSMSLSAVDERIVLLDFCSVISGLGVLPSKVMWEIKEAIQSTPIRKEKDEGKCFC